MVDFHGWSMPINYGSQINEHNSVRENCGMFDVSHMTILDFKGKEVNQFIRKLIANDINKLSEDYEGLYSAMLNDNGFVIDDLIAYKMDFGYRLVVNCATRGEDLKWISSKACRAGGVAGNGRSANCRSGATAARKGAGGSGSTKPCERCDGRWFG